MSLNKSEKLSFFAELFELKFEEKWVAPYELAKVSLNNKGNEIRSSERRSNEGKPAMEEAEKENSDIENRSPFQQIVFKA